MESGRSPEFLFLTRTTRQETLSSEAFTATLWRGRGGAQQAEGGHYTFFNFQHINAPRLQHLLNLIVFPSLYLGPLRVWLVMNPLDDLLLRSHVGSFGTHPECLLKGCWQEKLLRK